MENARAAQRVLEAAAPATRQAVLLEVERALRQQEAEILAANEADVKAAAHLPGPMVARLRLNAPKLRAICAGVRRVAEMDDLLGEELEQINRPNGLRIKKVRVPLGVIGIIYEARPNVTVDAAALCLKAGNAVMLKGGKEAGRTNAALGAALQAGLRRVGLPAELAQILPPTREAAHALMNAVGLVDVLIPRGGAGLIQTVLRESRVPVIETGAGVCHVYVHRDADLAMAAEILINAKCSNPAVCNAAETLLVDRAIADEFLAMVTPRLQHVTITDEWGVEYNDLTLAIRVVEGVDEALAHIAQYGTRHSEAIVTENETAAARFLRTVDAAAVYHNASTRFTDGGEFGFGAEIGISTQKLHARGPMGLAALTSYKYIIHGTGQVRN